MVSALWFPYSFNFAFPKQNQNDNCIQYTDTGYPILTYIGIWRTRPYLDQPASLASPGLLPSGPYNDGFFAWKKKKEIMHAYKGIWRQFLKATDMGLLKGGSHHSLYVKGEFTPPGHFQLISQATTYLELVKLFSILDGFYYLILRDSRNSRKGSLVGE